MKTVDYDPKRFERLTAEITLKGVMNMGGAAYYYDRDGVRLLWGPVNFYNSDPMMEQGLFSCPLQSGPVETDDVQHERYLYVTVRLENLFATGWPGFVQVRILGWTGAQQTELKKEVLFDGTLDGRSDATVGEVYRLNAAS
jgi:hypothetical protein